MTESTPQAWADIKTVDPWAQICKRSHLFSYIGARHQTFCPSLIPCCFVSPFVMHLFVVLCLFVVATCVFEGLLCLFGRFMYLCSCFAPFCSYSVSPCSSFVSLCGLFCVVFSWLGRDLSLFTYVLIWVTFCRWRPRGSPTPWATGLAPGRLVCEPIHDHNYNNNDSGEQYC